MNVPVYKVKSLEDSKERIIHENMLLPLGVKFIPEHESDYDSDKDEEPEFEACHFERQVPEKISQPISDMTPLAQSNLEYGQEYEF